MHNRISNRAGTLLTALGLAFSAAFIAPQSLSAQTFTVIYTFAGGTTDGNAPFGTPVLYNGNIYGTTTAGGAHNNGTIYEVNFATRHAAVLHSFAGPDGADPLAGLIQDAAGNLYGTTYGGGTHGRGTLFKVVLSPASYTVLHSFAGPPNDGAQPAAPLSFDSAFNIYGTTYDGGNTSGYGTTFELPIDGAFTVGQSFPPGGALPRGGLIGLGGKFYGTTSGSPTRSTGGTIFETFNSAPLYTFTGGADGAQPMAGLIADGLGNLYGTASAGGDGSYGLGHGVVFSYNINSGVLTVLHTFNGADGFSPMSSLVRDPSGNLYGTTLFGGASNNGTVFKLDPTGKLTTLHSFTGGADGARPMSGVLVDAKGNVWGTASGGGASGAGTLFIISPPPTT